MSTLYDNLLGGSGTINYNSGTPAVTYPDADIYNVSAPIWLPRVYGSGLTSFEVASSGSIAITVQDVHSLDFDHSTE